MVLHYVGIVIVSVCYCFSGYHDTNCIQVICIFVKVIVFGPILSGLLKSWPACEGADKAMFSFAAIPLSVEWSTYGQHDLLLVGCHDGTVSY